VSTARQPPAREPPRLGAAERAGTVASDASATVHISVDTAFGQARVHLQPVHHATGALILGHGAGGGVAAPDLVAAAEAARAVGFVVALAEQPYRVAGRRSQPPTRQLDSAWTSVVEHLRANDLRGHPFVVGGRSAGARVACRTAHATGAAAVLCLAFPFQPPRRAGAEPAPSRLDELDAVELPTLVVQGERDPFGVPPAAPLRRVVTIAGDHNLKRDLAAVSAAVRGWLEELPRGPGA